MQRVLGGGEPVIKFPVICLVTFGSPLNKQWKDAMDTNNSSERLI